MTALRFLRLKRDTVRLLLLHLMISPKKRPNSFGFSKRYNTAYALDQDA